MGKERDGEVDEREVEERGVEVDVGEELGREREDWKRWKVIDGEVWPDFLVT